MSDQVGHKSVQSHEGIHNGLEDLLHLTHNVSDYDEESVSRKVTHITNLVQEFEQSPALLDAHLGYYMETLTFEFNAMPGNDRKVIHIRSLLASLIYAFSKVRGYKAVINFLPCDVYSISKLIDLTNSSKSDVELFTCLLWLCNLVLVPFPLDTIDPQLARSLFNIGLSNLEKHRNLSRNQIVSLLLLSRLLTRSDVLRNQELLPGYFGIVKNEWFASVESENKLGHLITVCRLLKMCSIDELEQFIPLVYKIISADMIKAQTQLQNTSITLYSVKILGKLAIIHIRKYQFQKVSLIINNLLNDIMTSKLGTFEVSLRYAMAKSLSEICSTLKDFSPNYHLQLLNYMLAQFSIENMDLNRTDTFNSGLIINPDTVEISKFHFLLLFLGYSTMKRSMPLSFVPALFGVVHQTLFLQQRGSFGDLSSPIRDSSCLVAWAICQTVSHWQYEELAHQNETMFLTIVCDFILAAITDPDLTIRKCAVAVVQELVGRYGQAIFRKFFVNDEDLGKFTVDVIELLDTHSLSSNVRSFALISKFEDMGFDKRIFIPKLLQKVLDDTTAHDVRILSLHCIASLYQRAVVVAPICPLTEIRNINLTSIIDTLKDQQKDILFAICVLYPLLPNSQAISFIELTYATFKYTATDTMEKAYGYLKWLTFNISQGKQPLAPEWDRLIQIASATSNKHVMESFAYLCTELRNHKSGLSPKTIDSFERLIKRDSSIAAYSVFGLGKLSSQVIDRLFLMMHNKALNIDTREYLIQSLDRNVSTYSLNQNQLQTLILLLDDYTITSQGDVGSKLRIATIKLIKKGQMWQHGPEVKALVKEKLIRLSSETMDKVRLFAFNVLNEIDGHMILDIDEWSVSTYFERLLTYYRNCVLTSKGFDLSSHFWSGYVFSMGSVSSPAMISECSFVSFLRFDLNLSGLERSFIFSELAKLLVSKSENNDRLTRRQMAVLNCFVKLLEANIQFPVDFDYSALFIRCYNLHINTTNTMRIGLVLKVFQNLISSTCPRSTKIKCAKRLIQLGFAAKDAKIRLMAAETLFEVLGDIAQDTGNTQMDLADIDWTMSISALSKHRGAIESDIVSSIKE